MDMIKTRMQLQAQLAATAPHMGFFETLTKVVREEGFFRGLFRGITPSMMREASYSSIRMGLYEPVRHWLVSIHPSSNGEMPLETKIGAGLISGGIGACIANPTDLVKIRFQSQKPTQPSVYRHTFDAFHQIYRDEGGLRGLYRGVGPTACRAAILTATQLASYDHSKHLIRKYELLPDGPAVHVVYDSLLDPR